MNIFLPIIIAAVGASGIIGQMIIVRQLIVNFMGNELTCGLVVGFWLLAEAAGVFLGGFLIDSDKAGKRPPYLVFVFFQILFLFFLTVTVTMTSGNIGAYEDMGPMLIKIFLAVFFPAFAHGGLFSVGIRLIGAQKNFIWESAGTLLGGFLMSVFLVSAYSHREIVQGLVCAGLVCCLPIIRAMSAGRAKNSAYFLTAGAILLAMLWASRSVLTVYDDGAGRLVAAKSSPYASMAVYENENQRVLYYSGVPFLSWPAYDAARAQDFALIPLLFNDDPRDVLVIEGGIDTLDQLSSYNGLTIDHVYQDSELAAVQRVFLKDEELKLAADEKGVLSINEDARSYISGTSKRYDIVYLGSPLSPGLLSNRFYTEEFFALAARCLRPNGIFVLRVPGSYTYLGPELRELNAIILAGLRKNFFYVLPLPGDPVMYLASARNPLDMTPGSLAAAASFRLPGAGRLSEPFFEDILSSTRLDWFYKNVRPREVRLRNRDFFPRLVYTQWQYEKRKSEMSIRVKESPFIPLFFASKSRNSVGIAVLAAVVVAAVAAMGVVLALQSLRRRVIVFATATSGWWGMTLSMQLLLAYQSVAGAFYQTGALLVGLFMAGTTAGAAAFQWRRIRRIPAYRLMILSEWCAVGLTIILFLFFSCKNIFLLYNIKTFGFLLIAAGVVLGFEFAVAMHLYSSPQNEGPNPWALYAADLMGGFAAAAVIGTYFFPVCGLLVVLIIAFLFKLASVGCLLLFGKEFQIVKNI